MRSAEWEGYSEVGVAAFLTRVADISGALPRRRYEEKPGAGRVLARD